LTRDLQQKWQPMPGTVNEGGIEMKRTVASLMVVTVMAGVAACAAPAAVISPAGESVPRASVTTWSAVTNEMLYLDGYGSPPLPVTDRFVWTTEQIKALNEAMAERDRILMGY
jgi:hypothetical protein